MAPRDAMVLYDVAAVRALAGHRDEGLDYLERAVESGFAYRPDSSSIPTIQVANRGGMNKPTRVRAVALPLPTTGPAVPHGTACSGAG